MWMACWRRALGGLARPDRVADPSEVALDPLYDDAVARGVRQLDKATVMLLQSEFNIGATAPSAC